MNWEQRLRDMVLAGAALTATACSDSVQSTVDAAGSASGSASGSIGASSGSASGAGSGNASGSNGVSTGSSFCCNANQDPCCYFVHCGGSMTPACACTSDGGTWSYSGATCSFSHDAGPADAVEDNDAADATDVPYDAIDDKDATQANDGPSDAPSDSMSHHDVNPFCCNANPDPCCRFQYCGDLMTPACACKSDGGTWGNGSVCSFPPEAGSSETGADGGAHD